MAETQTARTTHRVRAGGGKRHLEWVAERYPALRGRTICGLLVPEHWNALSAECWETGIPEDRCAACAGRIGPRAVIEP